MDGTRIELVQTTETLCCARFKLFESRLEQERRCNERLVKQAKNKLADKSVANFWL